jgi:hypothetical protein
MEKGNEGVRGVSTLLFMLRAGLDGIGDSYCTMVVHAGTILRRSESCEDLFGS